MKESNFISGEAYLASDLARSLNGNEKSPGQFMSLCPAPDDKNPSLSIIEQGGKILLHCFAGCGYDAIVNALNNRGIDVYNNSELSRSPGLPNGIQTEIDGKHYVALWPYHNEQGDIIGYVVRYESHGGEKSYIPYFKEQDGKWNAGFGRNVPRPLYNLDKVSDVSVEEEIWVVEVEKCVDTLTQLGIIATTSPSGSNSTAKTNWTPLANHRIVI